MQQQIGHAVMLGLRIHRQINDVQPLLLMQLGCPPGVQIIPPHKKVPEGF